MFRILSRLLPLPFCVASRLCRTHPELPRQFAGRDDHGLLDLPQDERRRRAGLRPAPWDYKAKVAVDLLPQAYQTRGYAYFIGGDMDACGRRL